MSPAASRCLTACSTRTGQERAAGMQPPKHRGVKSQTRTSTSRGFVLWWKQNQMAEKRENCLRKESEPTETQPNQRVRGVQGAGGPNLSQKKRGESKSRSWLGAQQQPGHAGVTGTEAAGQKSGKTRGLRLQQGWSEGFSKEGWQWEWSRTSQPWGKGKKNALPGSNSSSQNWEKHSDLSRVLCFQEFVNCSSTSSATLLYKDAGNCHHHH